MAQINVIQPTVGTIVVLSSSPSAYTVRYDKPSGEQVVTGPFQVYCHACGETLLSSSDNPATFNISSLTESGHPGPFDISKSTAQGVEITVYTSPDSTEKGTTEPEVARYVANVGGTVTFPIHANEKDGYTFSHWTELGSSWTSSTAWLQVTRPVTGPQTYYFTAHFNVQAWTLKFWHMSACRSDYPIGKGVSQTTASDPDSGVVNVLHDGTGDIVARLSSNGLYATGSSVTISVSMTAAASRHDIMFAGFCESIPGIPQFPTSETSVTFTMPARAVRIIALFRSSSTLLQTVRTYYDRYGYVRLADENIMSTTTSSSVYSDGGWVVSKKVPLYPDGAEYTTAGDLDRRGREITVCVPEEYDLSRSFGIVTWRNLDRTNQHWTPQCPHIIHHKTLPTIGIAQTDGQIYTAYLCTHLLLCDYEGKQLLCDMSTKDLLCECYAPPE